MIGFDDIPEAAYFLPPLTTVRQDFGELGRRARWTLLVDLIHGTGPVRVGRTGRPASSWSGPAPAPRPELIGRLAGRAARRQTGTAE